MHTRAFHKSIHTPVSAVGVLTRTYARIHAYACIHPAELSYCQLAPCPCFHYSLDLKNARPWHACATVLRKRLAGQMASPSLLPSLQLLLSQNEGPGTVRSATHCFSASGTDGPAGSASPSPILRMSEAATCSAALSQCFPNPRQNVLDRGF